MMERIECLRFLASLRKDELALTHMGVTATEWLSLTGDNEKTFYLKSAMGMVSSFGLGLSVTLPNRQIWAFDGDGSFVMNFGGLLTMASLQPKNMRYFLCLNYVYESPGGQPIVNIKQTDFVGMAKSAGIRNAYIFNDIELFKKEIPAILARDEFSFVVMEIEKAKGKYETFPADPIEQTYHFGRYLERTEKISILK